jgi:hypothetical protein
MHELTDASLGVLDFRRSAGLQPCEPPARLELDNTTRKRPSPRKTGSSFV